MQTHGTEGTLPEEQSAEELNPERQATLPMVAEQLCVEPTEITQQDPEQEQTQELSPELQSTIPRVVEHQNVEQQPTQSMAVEQQKPEEQDTLPIATRERDLEIKSSPSIEVARQKEKQRLLKLPGKQHRDFYTTLLWWTSLVIFAVLLVSVVIGRSAIDTWFSHNFTHNVSTTPPGHVNHPNPNPSRSSLIDNAAFSFMDAMMHKDWATMWTMLTPDAQQLWRGEKDFLHFEQAKYGSLTFISYHDSATQMQYTWRDPDSTRVYTKVATLRVSLESTAPRGLLSVPSYTALNKGLFNNTLFALVPYSGNWRVLVAGPADPNSPILVPASAPMTKLVVPIFMYHHVSNLPAPDLLEYGLTVTTTNFNAQLTWLQQQGYHSITMTELFDALYYGKALPAHPMILTFDDGYEDIYTDALPALLAHHYRGVFYIITGMIGGQYMTWKQVRTLAQDGMQIASHTIHHVNIGQPPAGTSTQNELLLSKETLETQLKEPIQFFCYPTGEPFHHDPIYEQQIVLADLFNDGYVGATLDPFSFDSAIQNAQTPYQMPRVRVSGGESMQLFIGILISTLNIDAIRLADGYSY
jgi:peptidoglycan/xylan/chitin deacetylase (PgdA/CDA1 family)